MAAAGPNRSLAGDAAYIASVCVRSTAPSCWSGTPTAARSSPSAGVEDNVVGLVYLAGYALDEGESLGGLQGTLPRLRRSPTPWSTPRSRSRAPTNRGWTSPWTSPDSPHIFAPDVDPGLTRVLAVSQRPLAAAAFGEEAGAAAWKTKPAWGVVASADRAINPDVERFGYERAQMKITEIDSSHLVMHAHPSEVVGVIREALASVAG